jgi:hypothetical protein
MIDLIQRHKIVVTCVITIPNSQSFIRAHVEEGEFPIRKFVRTRTRKRRTEQSATEQKKPDNRRL